MNTYFAAAAALTGATGAVHSILGERLVFRRMRGRGIVPVQGGQLLREAHVRILWASWHIVTVLGCGIAAVLWWLAQPENVASARSGPGVAAVAALGASAALVLVGTRGRHPGWVALLAAAVLAWGGMVA